jgi:hypothetical protein
MNVEQFLTIDEPIKHKKKSKAKGLPRSDHKHEYETVLLHATYNFKSVVPKNKQFIYPAKVCTICGRIKSTDKDPSYYVEKLINTDLPYKVYSKSLSEKALSLPKWRVNNLFGKFAVKEVLGNE